MVPEFGCTGGGLDGGLDFKGVGDRTSSCSYEATRCETGCFPKLVPKSAWLLFESMGLMQREKLGLISRSGSSELGKAMPLGLSARGLCMCPLLFLPCRRTAVLPNIAPFLPLLAKNLLLSVSIPSESSSSILLEILCLPSLPLLLELDNNS